ncbi:uncharacterized protein LOC143911097 [Arctopsyche grandis]|uniref:uncharacterized protein LOC143911097 n=1 Tax=Arctopsyche grandis TaxID=121162 RepID=UPI00406D8338
MRAMGGEGGADAEGSGSGLCRLCGSSAGRLSRSLLSEQHGHLLHLVLKYIGIPITTNDKLPTLICDDCVNKLELFHEYVQECIKTQALLHENSNLNLIDHDGGVKIEFELPDLENFKKETLDDNFIVKEEYVADEELSADNYLIDRDSFYDSNSDTPLTKIKTRKKLKIKRLKKSVLRERETFKESKCEPNLKKYIKFHCYVCQEKCANWFRLKAHILQIHNEPPKVRCECGYILKSKTAIYRHVANHNDPASFSCDQCSRITKTKTALEKHMMRHLPKENQIYACLNCPKICSSKENLKSHERVHFPLPERYKYPCGICGNKFTTKSAVLGHIRAVHEKLKRFVCDICGFTCSTGGELVQHRAIHSDEKLFQCSICSKRFKTSSNLKAHSDTHATTSYPCGVCGKVLNSRRTLRKHFLVHEDLCKHVCTYCNKAFKRRQTLKVHLTIHTGDKPIQCRWCSQKFAYSSVYRSHKHKVHFDKIIPNENLDNNVAVTENCSKIENIIEGN